MVLGSGRLNIIWKLLRNDSGVILKLLEMDSGSFFNVKIHNLNIFLDLKLIFYKIWEFWSDISTSSNKSGPGTHFKMCSRSWQYWRFEYHQKLLTQKWSYAFRKFRKSSSWAFVMGAFVKSYPEKNDLLEPLTFLEHFLKVWIEKWNLMSDWPI